MKSNNPHKCIIQYWHEYCMVSYKSVSDPSMFFQHHMGPAGGHMGTFRVIFNLWNWLYWLVSLHLDLDSYFGHLAIDSQDWGFLDLDLVIWA